MVALLCVLLAVGAVLGAVQEALWHDPHGNRLSRWARAKGGRVARFVDASVSWKNKYQGGNPLLGPRFPGSTTFLVGWTDAAHLAGLLGWACVDAGLLLLGWPRFGWWAILPVLVRRLVFEPLYRLLRS